MPPTFPADMVFCTDFAGIKKTAQALGFDASGIAIAKNFGSREEAEAARSAGFRTCKIIETRENREVSRWKNLADYVAVIGGTVEMNKFAVSGRGVDFLLSPCSTSRLPFDTETAQNAKDRGITVGVIFSDFLNSNQFALSLLLKNTFMLAKICRNRKTNLAVFSGAGKPEEMRNPENLSSLPAFFGGIQKEKPLKVADIFGLAAGWKIDVQKLKDTLRGEDAERDKKNFCGDRQFEGMPNVEFLK